MAKCLSHQMTKTFHFCKWISFANSTFVILEETPSALATVYQKNWDLCFHQYSGQSCTLFSMPNLKFRFWTDSILSLFLWYIPLVTYVAIYALHNMYYVEYVELCCFSLLFCSANRFEWFDSSMSVLKGNVKN